MTFVRPCTGHGLRALGDLIERSMHRGGGRYTESLIPARVVEGDFSSRSRVDARYRQRPKRHGAIGTVPLAAAHWCAMLWHADAGQARLLEDDPACTDLLTKPWVQEAGVEVLNQPFYADGNVATAGGCLSSQYLAAWVIARFGGIDSNRSHVYI